LARARQSAGRLALGGGAFEYVVSNEVGEAYNPAVLSRYWAQRVKAAGVVAVIAAWVGHKDATLTMRLYVHSQDEALKAAGESLNRVVTFGDIDSPRANDSNTI